MSEALHHLMKLSKVRLGKNIKFLTAAVATGGYCPMRVACNIVEDTQDLSYLMVGMPECAFHSRRTNTRPEGPHGELHYLYPLDANEVIFGCREGLIEALREMDREGPKAIMIIATCVTDLIGEDLDGLIEELQPELGARLSFVTLGQFTNFSGTMGTWKTAEALGKLMSPQPTNPNLANALFIEPWRSIGEEVEFPLVVGVLEERGVAIRLIAAGASLTDYIHAPDAALNLVTSALTQPLAAKMQASFGVPYAPLHNAFSVEAIDAAYAMIADTFGLSWDGAFDELRGQAAQLEERARKELQGLKYVMLPGVDMPIQTALYLAEFGMEPLLIHLDDLHPEDIGHAKQLKTLGFDPPVCRMMNIDVDIKIVIDLRPDISFGGLPSDYESSHAFRVAEAMGDFFGMAGYERTVEFLSRIFTVLETGTSKVRRQ